MRRILLKKAKTEDDMKKIKRIVFGLVLLAATVSGCAIGSGKTEVVKPTLGQELMELKNARENGAISEQEYEELKEKLKKSYN
jgi:hypothetical protein